jgi:hypothetical protein
MAKVCKVVLNSISHDARVLKEAEAIRCAGFDVTIIGIQDSNNSIPIEILENGVVLRRVAWTSTSVKPNLFSFLLSALPFSLFSIALFLLIPTIPERWPELLSLTSEANYKRLSFVAIHFTLPAIILIPNLYFFYRRFKIDNRKYKRLRKRESNLDLKYDDLLSSLTSRDPSPPTPSKSKPKTNHRKIFTYRPILCGLSEAFKPRNKRMWNSVFAREKSITKLLKTEKPSIVHAHDLSSLPLCAKFSRKHKIKLVFDAHEIYDHLAQSDDNLAELNGKLLKIYSPDVHRFITINTSIAQYYKKTYRSFPTATIIKNASIKAPHFNYDGRLHEAAGLDLNRQIIIYQGGFAPNRGLESLLLASEYLDDRWSIVFMGWGKLEDQLKRIALALILKKPSLTERIKFLPKVKQDELPLWTAGATLGAIPYENTGLNHWYCNPNKLWEYPNACVPILASPFPELSSYVNKYGIGWLLEDPLTPLGIAELINSLSEDEISIRRNNCRQFINEDNWSVYSTRLKELYTKI